MVSDDLKTHDTESHQPLQLCISIFYLNVALKISYGKTWIVKLTEFDQDKGMVK